MQSRHLSTVIAAAPSVVTAYIRDPGNLPTWAQGLATADVHLEGDALVVDSPMGQIVVRFADGNDLGVVDHDVTLPSGITQNNPMRVLTHPEGSEVVFTIRQLDLTDDEFERDCAQIQADLERLRELLTTA